MKVLAPLHFIVIFLLFYFQNNTGENLTIINQDTLYNDKCSHKQLDSLISNQDLLIKRNTNENDTSLILQLCLKGDIDSLKIILNKGYDINFKETHFEEFEEFGGCDCLCEKTAIFVASQQQNIKLVRFLIEKGANVYLKQTALQPLEPVLISRNYKLADLLLANGANKEVSACSFWEQESFTKYVSYYNMFDKGDTAFINYLIENQFPYPTEAYIWSEGPIEQAAMNGDSIVLRQLIPLSSKKDELSKALCFSTEFGIVKLLLEKGANVNYIYHWMGEGNSGAVYSPLYNAISTEQFDLVKYLIEKGANPNILFSKYNQQKLPLPSYFVVGFPLLKAVELGNISIAKLLIENGADVNFAVKQYFYSEQRRYKGRTETDYSFWVSPLVEAVENNDIAMVKLLIQNNASVVIDKDTITDYIFENEINPLIKKELIKKINK